MKILVSKKVSFEAAHHLPNYSGVCQRVHGHRWEIEVAILGEKDYNSGMVVDFKLLKELVQKVILDKMDHSDLNELVYNPTAENLAEYIWDLLKPQIQIYFAGVDLTYVRVWENPNSFAEYRGE